MSYSAINGSSAHNSNQASSYSLIVGTVTVNGIHYYYARDGWSNVISYGGYPGAKCQFLSQRVPNCGGVSGKSANAVIQAALREPGSVFVSPGTYPNLNTLVMSINGATLASSSAVFSFARSQSWGINVTANYVTINGLTFKGLGTVPSVAGMTYIDDRSANGFRQGLVVENCVFNSYPSTTMSSTDAVALEWTNQAIMLHNTVAAQGQPGSYGFVVGTSQNKIENNSISSTRWDSIFVDGKSSDGVRERPSNNVISGNVITNSGDGAIEDNNATGDRITGNQVSATNGFSSDGYIGCTNGDQECSVTSNLMTNTAGVDIFWNTPQRYSVDGALIQGNILVNTSLGIRLGNYGTNLQILGNSISLQSSQDAWSYGAISLTSGSYITVESNRIYLAYNNGISIVADSSNPISNLVVSGNEVVDSNQQGIQTAPCPCAGILVQSLYDGIVISNSEITNNVVRDNQTIMSEAYGIFVNGNGHSNILTNVTLSGNQVGALAILVNP